MRIGKAERKKSEMIDITGDVSIRPTDLWNE